MRTCPPGELLGADVFGQRAQVRLDGDTTFLAVFPDGWRMVAAAAHPATRGAPFALEIKLDLGLPDRHRW